MPVIPHYSLEAWLYTARKRADELCSERHRGPHAGARGWATEHLDEVERPKDSFCLADRANAELATALDVEVLLRESPSFEAWVADLLGCAALVDALAPA